MEEKVSYVTNLTTINNQNMQITVTNRHPQYLKKSQAEVTRELEIQLYRIFKKFAAEH